MIVNFWGKFPGCLPGCGPVQRHRLTGRSPIAPSNEKDQNHWTDGLRFIRIAMRLATEVRWNYRKKTQLNDASKFSNIFQDGNNAVRFLCQTISHTFPPSENCMFWQEWNVNCNLHSENAYLMVTWSERRSVKCDITSASEFLQHFIPNSQKCLAFPN